MVPDPASISLSLAERHQHILDKLKKEASINVLELCSQLNVSSVTIRKDLKLLENKNLLYRTHGGATLTNPYTSDRHVSEKEKIHSKEKMEIGQAGASLVQPDDCIIIASGTT